MFNSDCSDRLYLYLLHRLNYSYKKVLPDLIIITSKVIQHKDGDLRELLKGHAEHL